MIQNLENKDLRQKFIKPVLKVIQKLETELNIFIDDLNLIRDLNKNKFHYVSKIILELNKPMKKGKTQIDILKNQVSFIDSMLKGLFFIISCIFLKSNYFII